MIAKSPKREWTGKHTLAALLLFFGTVFAINGTMVWFAMDSWPGLVERLGWKEGKRFNDLTARRVAQDALGWQVSVGTRKSPGNTYRVEVLLKNRAGLPLDPSRLKAVLKRPVTEIMDLPVIMRRTAPGVYLSDSFIPGRGNWRVGLSFEAKDQPRWQREFSIWVE